MRSEDRPVDPKLLEESLQILREHFSADCTIVSAVYLSELERRNVIVRIMLQSSSQLVPPSVILKQSLPVRSEKSEMVDPHENKKAFERFSRDWAGLEFASSIPQSLHNVPHFYGAHHDRRFILIEDLGQKHVSLVDSLTAGDQDAAVSALERYMKALGSFHAASFGLTNQYDETLNRVNRDAKTAQAEMDLTMTDLLMRLSDVFANDKLALLIPGNFEQEVRQVMEGIFKPGPFTVVTHGDIAPDNVFDHQGDKGLQLIDFEWSGVRNALMDGTYLRMSMPTGWCARTTPDDIIAHAEKVYRDELKKSIPSAGKDDAYALAYTQACAFHVLQQIAVINKCLDKNEVWPSGPVPDNSLWDPSTNFMQSRVLTRLQAFIDVATVNNLYPAITQIATETLSKVKERWPDAQPLGMYPAFNTVSLQSKVTSPGIIAKRIGATKSTLQLQQAQELQLAQEREKSPRQDEKSADHVAATVPNSSSEDHSVKTRRTPFATKPTPPWEEK